MESSDLHVLPQGQEMDFDVVYDLLTELFGTAGMRMAIMTPDGTSINRTGQGREFCDYIQNAPGLKEQCSACAVASMEQARLTDKPYFYLCHMGLVATVMPLKFQGRLVAYLVFSGYRMEPENMRDLPYPMPIIDVARSYPQLSETYRDKVPFYSKERIDEIVQLLSVTASHLVEVSIHAQMLMQLQNKSLELLTSANMREQQERKANQSLQQSLADRMWNENVYDILNQAAILARQEHADQTGQLLEDLTLYLRKGCRSGAVIPLSQEIEEDRSHMRMLQTMLEGRIVCTLDADPNCDPDLELPQFPLASLTDAALRGPLIRMEQGGRLTLRIRQESQWILFSLVDNSSGHTPEQVRRLNQLQFDEEDEVGIQMGAIIREMRNIYGRGFRWHYTSQPNVRNELTFSLPIGG